MMKAQNLCDHGIAWHLFVWFVVVVAVVVVVVVVFWGDGGQHDCYMVRTNTSTFGLPC